MRKARTFSDATVAESCSAVHSKKQCLLNHKVGESLVIQGSVVQNDIDELVAKLTHDIDTVDIANLTLLVDRVFTDVSSLFPHLNSYEKRSLIIEIVSEQIDSSHLFNDRNYVKTYRPIVKDILPNYITKLQTCSEYENIQLNTPKKKRCVLL